MTQRTVIILDIGRNTLDLDENSDKSFFLKSKEFVTRVIERKIIIEEKELLGILLMGSESKDPISMTSKLEVPSWNMIRSLPRAPTAYKGDWLKSLVYAGDIVSKTNIFDNMKIVNKRIILITNSIKSSDISEDKENEVINLFNKESIQFDVFGCDLYEEANTNCDLSLAKKLVEVTNGVNMLFGDAMKELNFYRKKYVTGNPWKVDLCIGPNIKIPISSYIRTKDEKVLKTWSEAIKDMVTNKASTSKRVKKKTIYFNEDNKIVNSKNLIKGVTYGKAIIPISSLDKRLNYNSGSRSLNIYGFTSASNLKWENLNYNNLSYVFGNIGDKKAENAIQCLAKCLMEENLIAIARGVKKENCAPRMYALMPLHDVNEFICLSMVGICYKDEIQHMTFPQTECKKFICSNEQVDAFKNLIEVMDLSNNDNLEDPQIFQMSGFPSPSVQYAIDCVVHRAKYPNMALPKPRTDIFNLFQVPSRIKLRAAEPLEKLKSLFDLRKTKDNEKDNNSELIDVAEDSKIVTKAENVKHLTLSDNLERIGTVNPIEDYKLSINLGKPLNTVGQEMTDAIETLAYSNLAEHKIKALDAMLFYRKESLQQNPLFYNKWLKNFKMERIDRKMFDVLKLIEHNEMDFILNHENKLSEIKSLDSEMYEMDTVSDFADVTISSEVTELFNNM